MKANIYIPFSNSDAQYGFTYDGPELTPKKYVKMENDEYYDHKDGVDHMVLTSLGNNMAINNYQKRKINVKPQTIAFHTCYGNIRNIDGSDVTEEQLEKLSQNKEQFALFIYLNQEEFQDKPDLEIDLKMWIQESQKIMRAGKLSEEEKVFHLPKRDFKIDICDGKEQAVLKNCKFAKLLSSATNASGEVMVNSFGMIIERIVFLSKK